MTEWFSKLARASSRVLGSPWSFVTAATIIAVWAVTGALFRYSDTWQLVINTGTTIVTFLAVFLIQNAQNHDSRAIQLKLDELLRALNDARNDLVDLEDMSEEELTSLEEEFRTLRTQAAAGCEPGASAKLRLRKKLKGESSPAGSDAPRPKNGKSAGGPQSSSA